MTTEAEAKEKWCPMVRMSFGVAAVNCPESDDDTGRDRKWNKCIGSQCMMWRWDMLPSVNGPKEMGHCGLAGDVDKHIALLSLP